MRAAASATLLLAGSLAALAAAPPAPAEPRIVTERIDYGIPGVKYDARADRRSWEHMRDFFRELFGE